MCRSGSGHRQNVHSTCPRRAPPSPGSRSRTVLDAAAGSAAGETFTCPQCDLCIGRDLNGAIGNFYAAYGEAVGIGWDRKSG